MEVDPALLARAAARLAALADEPVGRWDCAGFGSARVRAAAEGTDAVVRAAARAVGEGVADAERRIRAVEARWRAQDAALAGRS